MADNALLYQDAVSVTPSDSVNLDKEAGGIYVGGAGDASILMRSGNAVTFNGITAGTLLPLRVLRVNSTGTTATNIVALS